MKQIITTLLLISMITAKASTDLFNVYVQSATNISVTGSATYNAYLVSLDTLELDTGFIFHFTKIQSLSGSMISGSTNMLPGDTAFFQFSINYNTNNLPYYPVELISFKKVISKYGDTLKAEFWSHLFFTPWNKIELMNHQDFKHCGRLWKNENENPNAQRVYISESSIPASTWVEPDTSAAEWEEVPQYRTIPNLPYHIKMAAVHTDTLIFYDDHYGDTIPAGGQNFQNAFIVGPRYLGTIRGRLVARIENDLGQFTDEMPLSGILVELKESDMGDLYRVQIAETQTDNDGVFRLEYDTRQPFEGGSIELFLHISSKNKHYNIKVKDPMLTGFNTMLGTVDEEIFDIEDQDEGNAGTIDIGDFLIHNEAMHVTNWAEKAFRYADDQGLDVGLGFLNYLTILVNSNNSFTLPNSILRLDNFFPVLPFLTDPTIRLDRVDSRHENTLYHEWGHFFMWKLQGKNFITRLDDDGCFGKFGNHDWNEEQHLRMVWTEGFADAIEMILDGVYWRVDNEYGYECEPNGTARNRDNSNRFEDREIFGDLNNGLKSEYYLACAIYDLWDGVDKGLPNRNDPNTPNVTLPGAAGLHPFNDRTIGGGGGNWTEPDNISMSFYSLISPLKENGGATGKLHNIYEYYDYILNHVAINDCNLKLGIGECFRQNRVMIDIEGFENAANFLDFNNSISSDAIYETTEITDWGKTIVCTEMTDVINYFQNPVENTANEVTSIPNYSFVGGLKNYLNSLGYFNGDSLYTHNFPQISPYITDDLRLGFNFPNNASTFNIGTNVDYPFNLETSTCGNLSWEFGNTTVYMGATGGKTAIVHFNSGSNLVLRNNSIIRISNNSKLIIEIGATLDIFPGTRIILNGANAILDIKGTINIHDGATFTFEGGSAGSGHVVFNTESKSDIILGNNSKIKFEGDGIDDRVMEVPAGKVFWPDNNNGAVQTSFELRRGHAALGTGAIINIGTPVTLSSCRFYAEPQSRAHAIYLWGYKHYIVSVTVENVAHGIQSFNVAGGNPLIMSGVHVLGADEALLSEGKGSTLTHFYSEDNPMGITINASVWPNTFQYPHVNGTTSVGTLYRGGISSSNLWIKKADYTDNLEGVNYTGSGSLVLSCGNFYNVLPSSANGNGITQFGGTLVAADALGYVAGRVSFKDNRNTIALLKTQPYLDNGYNNLSYISSSTGLNLALRGSIALKPKSGNTISATNNLWDGTNVPTTLCAGSGSYQNYNLTYKRRPTAATVCVTIPNPTIALSTINTEQTSRCSSTWGTGTGSGGKGTMGTAMVINTTHFPNTNLQVAVDSVLGIMFDTTTTDYNGVINLWDELLNEPTYLQPYSEEDYYYIDLIENKIMETLGMLLSKDTTLELSQSGNEHFVTVLALQNSWITTVADDTTYLGEALKNKFNFDKGAVYHLEGSDLYAEEQWSDMQAWANDEYLEHTDYWLCQLVREAAIKGCGNNPDSLENIPVCQYSNGENAFRINGVYDTKKDNQPKVFDLRKENKISKHLTLYPNPATTSVTAELETSQKGTATINIYSADGKCIRTTSNIKLGLGINKLTIPVSDITPGVYTIAIETRNIKWNEKVIIE